MHLSHLVRKAICKQELTCLRFLRWTVLVPLVIYISLLFVKYNKSVPLKSLPTPSDKEGVAMDHLFFELEAVTADRENLAVPKDAGIDRHGDDASIREVVEAENRQDPRNLLEDIFRRADTDDNQLLDIQELAKWIHAKITEHITRAMRENVGLFTAIDNNPRNGEVSWDEYHVYFLRTHGFSEAYINSHDKKHSEMPRALKESIMRDRARWAEAARNDPEKLALDEFLAFTHPESSHRALLQMVEDLFEKFGRAFRLPYLFTLLLPNEFAITAVRLPSDRDGDEQLTEDEFSDLPSEGVGLDLREDRQQSIGGSEDRRKEFRHLIDKNKNGKADRTELLMYIDPRNPRHAIQEAQHLITLSDTNLDGKVDLPEILSKMDLFLDSKMVDTEKSFHDEFR